MKTLPLGASGLRVSAITFGGWQAGREYWVGIDDEESVAAHRAAFEAGITTFDTAEEYGDGHSERILRRALGSVRQQILIATKVSWRNLAAPLVRAACERSLRNLGTDVIDLYQIHWPAGTFGSPKVPIEETMSALLELKQQGKIRAIGVSNFSRAQLEAALKVGPVDSLQPPWSLLFRHVEGDALPLCRERGVTVLAYSPLAQGLLTGRFGPGHQFPPEDNRADNRLFQEPTYSAALRALDQMRPVAQRYGVSLGNLALAWLVAQPACAIAGARSPAQARENALAGAVELLPEDVEALGALGLAVWAPLAGDGLMWSW